jgi:hypothetical protein
MWLVADLEMRRCLLRHPDGQTGKRTVRLSNNHELDAAALKPSRDDHGLTVARMEPVSDPAFSRLFAGSMSCVRGGVAQRAGCQSYDRSGQPSCAASSACHTTPTLSRCFEPSDAPAGHTGGWICGVLREVELGRDIGSQ